MVYRKKIFLLLLSSLLIACQSSVSSDKNLSISFTPVGESFGGKDIIDLEFLPGQNGDAIVIRKNGTITYAKKVFVPLKQTAKIATLDRGEQGLLNVAADPGYALNKFIYLYYTKSDGSQNQVDRLTVTVDGVKETFSLHDQQMIINFPKSVAKNPGSNHNGGGLLFDKMGNLMIGVGDGGGIGSSDKQEAVSMNVKIRLGKILRIVPGRMAGKGSFSIPTGGNQMPRAFLPEIYAYGLRNPFTLAYDRNTLFIGDVGWNQYEEIDVATRGGLNFGWPMTEGPTKNPKYVSPLHGYSHDNKSFAKADSQATWTMSLSIMVLNFYTGKQYNGALKNCLIYSEFYVGWVRCLKLNSQHNMTKDSHIGHLNGFTSLQEGPDGWLYAVSFFGASKILRLDVVQ